MTPAQAYAANAGTGSVAGAAATLLVTHDTGEAAEAVLAGSPKAARYGPAAFNSVLGTDLARTGVLVRGGDRLRQLEIADSLVLHADALRSLPAAEDEEPAPTTIRCTRGRRRCSTRPAGPGCTSSSPAAPS